MGNPEKINFIGIGAQKSGTSWLFKNLSKLPDFTLLPIKELHYFDRNHEYRSSNALNNNSFWERINNPDWVLKFKNNFLRKLKKKKFQDIQWQLKYFLTQSNDEWYLSLFKSCNGIKGEVTPSYSILKIVDIQKMYNVAPNAKLILLLRNPIYRAWSQYLHEWRREDDYSTKKMDSKIAIQFLSSKKQTLRSDYEQTINNYLSVYPRDQLLICFYDAIEENPKQLMETIVDFIGGDSSNISKHLDLSQKFNTNPKIEMPEEVFEFLKLEYQSSIERMALKYGGYFKVWQDKIYNTHEFLDPMPEATLMI